MTDYNKLARRIVAQEIGNYTGTDGLIHFDGAVFAAEKFCQDGRVVLALMEKMIGLEWQGEIDSGYGRGWEAYNVFTGKQPYKYHRAFNESLALAIVEACLEALESDGNEQ